MEEARTGGSGGQSGAGPGNNAKMDFFLVMNISIPGKQDIANATFCISFHSQEKATKGLMILIIWEERGPGRT